MPVAGVVEEAAYRIVQEALTNVVRHSGAGRAAVVLEIPAEGPDAGQLTITVDDDGRGAAGAPEGNGDRDAGTCGGAGRHGPVPPAASGVAGPGGPAAG